MNHAECLFCRIINRTVPAKIIAENNYVVAFNDINPMAPVHVLIIPKIHFANINYLDHDNLSYVSQMMLMAKELAQILHINKSGYRLVINNELAANQSVFHLHAHLLGGRNFSWPPG